MVQNGSEVRWTAAFSGAASVGWESFGAMSGKTLAAGFGRETLVPGAMPVTEK